LTTVGVEAIYIMWSVDRQTDGRTDVLPWQ